MNEYAIQHIPESKYCFATDGKTVRLRLRTDRNDNPQKIEVIYGGKYTFATTRETLEMKKGGADRLFRWYTAELKLPDVRLVYVFRIEEKGKIYYFSEDGLSEKFDFELSYYNSFQYAYVNECDVLKPIEWMRGARIYQIFVDRYYAGDDTKDRSYINMKWGDKPTPHSFAGGDLKGITEKLDYIRSLGMNCIYLTPIFKSASNHKYDISDYYAIDPMFGDKAALKQLITEAHERGIRVILDAVFNHCSSLLPQFRDVLTNKEKSIYREWFVIDGFQPLRYECFASCKYMPKLNTGNPEVRKYLIDVGKYWVTEFDIDGWRLDVSDEVSHLFWKEFRQQIKAVKPECVLLGENWHDANAYLRGDEFDGIMNYAFTKACLDFYAFSDFTPADFSDKLNEILMRNTDTVNMMMLNLLDSHDTHRFLTRVKGDIDKLKSALCVLFFFVGAPSVYYGTECALEGGYDPDNRRSMPWDKPNAASEVAELIKNLSELKARYLTDDIINISEDGGLVLIKRGKSESKLLTLAVNNGGNDVLYKCDNVLLSCKYANGRLANGGFVVHAVKGGGNG